MPRLALLALLTASLVAAGCIKFEDPPPVSTEPTAGVEATGVAGTPEAGTEEAVASAEAVGTAEFEETADAQLNADATSTAESIGTAGSAASEPPPKEGTAVPGDSSATPAAPSPLPPETAMPPAATVPSLIYPTRIEFTPGAESASVSGVLASGGDRVGYVLRAMAGQTMRVLLSDTPSGQVIVDVRGADGVPIGADATSAGLAYELETSQDYLIALATTGGAPPTSYAMTVYIAALESPIEPERIEFAPGAESATVSGNLASGGDTAAYVLRAVEDQTLRLFASGVPAAPLSVVVRDASGSLLPGSVEGAGWSHYLPATGDYTIVLGTPPGAPAVRYSLTAYVAAPDEEPEPVRIEFDPGSESATVTGGLPDGGGGQDYLLRALAGQTMHMILGSLPHGSAELEIYGPLGQYVGVVPDGPARAFELPETGDYTLSVQTDDGSAAASYSLTVYIPAPVSPSEPERIEFAPGGVSATVAGSLPSGGGERAYVLNARSGQDMHVAVANTPAGPIAISAEGPDGEALPGAAAWAGTSFSLPASGDYIVRITAPPGAPATDFTMTVSVH